MRLEDNYVCGCIDLGSSYFRLLVVRELSGEEEKPFNGKRGEKTGRLNVIPYSIEGEPSSYRTEVFGKTVVATESRRFVGWGRFLGRGIRVDRASLEIACTRLRELLTLSGEAGCPEPVLIGTNLFREAENSAELKIALEEYTGLEVNVLSQKGEASLGFRGAMTVIGDTEKGVTVDLGGTSTEIAYGLKGVFEDFISIPFGAQRVAEAVKNPFFNRAIYRRFVINGMGALMEFIGDEPFFLKLIGMVKDSSCHLVLTGGTAVSLSVVYEFVRRGQLGIPELVSMDIDEFELIKRRVLDTFALKREHRLPLESSRVPLFLPGLTLLESILKTMGRTGFFITPRDLRWGVVVSKGIFDTDELL